MHSTTTMAASTKDKKLSKAFKERLDALHCPYTEDVDESWIAELIFKPGEPRIRLLQWLLSTFDSKLDEELDPQYASMESKMDSRIQRLLFVTSTLGLCRYDDVDLIRGVTSASKQAAFMDHLIDIVLITASAEDPHSKALLSPGIVSDASPLDEQFNQSCLYMDSLARQENLDLVYNPRLDLLPPDIQRQVEKSWSDKGHDKNKPPKLELAAIADSAIELAKSLERQRELLQELKNNFDYQEADESRTEKVCKTLSLVLSELSQLVTGFSYCYENEMSHWCNKMPPTLTQLGPAFKRVHNLLQQFVQLLQSLKSIRNCYTNLSREASQQIPNLISKDDRLSVLASAGEAALESFQECLGVLDDSMQRRDADISSSSTLHSSFLKM
ncbi:hypothetical protein ACJMK2_016809 [Sinanodonta woodiana]|uniref:HAUS augmin-like complex subunit 7 n=1 Tax=Sinanodonta woodiana TaxID=1069815 RepID=A0ABD3UUW8_SINWO